MKERPILFNATMVRAILEGRKTMTRRLIKRHNSYYDGVPIQMAQWDELDWASPEIFADAGPSPAGNPGPYLHVPEKDGDCTHRIYPRYHPGDRLWAKEIWARLNRDGDPGAQFVYKASANPGDIIDTMVEWKSSRFMPRIASRILLEITNVRVEQLQEITRNDAIAEGGEERNEDGAWLGPEVAFCRLWESIIGPGSWEANPWVWVIEFKMLKP
jgi:hypothetical protein